MAVKQRSPLLPIFVGVAAVVALAGGIVLLRGGDDTDDDPVALVRDYFDAFRDGDCESAVDLIDTDGEPGEQNRDGWVDACRRAYESEGTSIDGAEMASAELVAEDGDRAIVRTEVIEGGEAEPSEPEDVEVIRVDGNWRIDLGDRFGATGPDDPDAGQPTTEPAADDAASGNPAP